MADFITLNDPSDSETGIWEPQGNGSFKATGTVGGFLLGDSRDIECRVVYDAAGVYPFDTIPGEIITFSDNWQAFFPSLAQSTPNAILMAILTNSGQLVDVKAIDVKFSSLKREK
jgi:hypothetical protein